LSVGETSLLRFALSETEKGEAKAQACDIAWLQQLAWITTVRKYNCSQGSNYV